jgi:integrase
VRANRCLEVLSKAMALAELWELRPQGTNPCHGIASNGERKRKRYLSRDELQRLLAALDTFADAGVRWRFAQLVRLLLLTGCRINELMAAEWSWLDEQAARLTLPPEAHKTGGDGSERVIHLPPAASLILRELRRETNSRWIIAGDGDGHLVGYWRMWSQLLEHAGIENLRIHDLRRSYASIGLSAGLSLDQIGELLGHNSPQTTARYAFLVEDAAKAAAALIGDCILPSKLSVQ